MRNDNDIKLKQGELATEFMERNSGGMSNGHENPREAATRTWLSLLSYLLFLVAAGLLVWWIAAGHHPWTTTQRLVSVPATDPLFGTTVMTQRWVNQLTPGIELIGPIALVFTGLGLWFLERSKRT